MEEQHDAWGLPPANPTLSPAEVHVWRVSLNPAPPRLERLATILGDDERLRADRFRFAPDRARFTAAHGLLRTVLGRYLGIDAHRLRFTYSPNGKPRLKWPANGGRLSFSLSHSGEIGLFAITSNRHVGVDVEFTGRAGKVVDIAGALLTEREHTQLLACPVNLREVMLLRYWTCKEAYLKATGEGLSRRLTQVEISLTGREPPRLIRIAGDPTSATTWSLRDLLPASDYIGAVAVEGTDWRLMCWGYTD